MKSIVHYLVIVAGILTITSCTNNVENNEAQAKGDTLSEVSSDYLKQADMNEDSLITDMLANADTTSNCGYKDGTYPASVSYQNIKTENKQVLAMQVQVEDCRVVKILSSEGVKKYEIRPAELDSNGTTTTLEGTDGTIYEVHISK